MEEETFKIPIWISYGRDEKSSNNHFGLYRTENTSCNPKSVFERVCDILKQEKINVKSDKDLTWGDNLNEFEEKFKQAKLCIIILNDKYLTSEHCMNEWKKIHQSKKGKKILYIKFNEETIINKDENIVCARGFDLNISAYRTLLYKYWMNFFSCHYAMPSKPEIVDLAIKNGCYFDEINQIHSLTDNNYTLRSNKNNFDEVVGRTIREFKSMYSGTFYNRLIKSILINNPILVVGDSVLECENDCLGNVLNKELERWLREKWEIKDLRDWNRNEYREDVGIEEHGYDTIDDYTKDSSCAQRFVEFLDKGQFRIIFSFGYSNQIFFAVKEYAEKRFGKKGLLYISLQHNDFAEKCKNSTVHPVVFFDLVRDRNAGINDCKKIVFSEKGIVDLISNVIVAMRNVDIINNKSVLALGTNIPGWGLRFLWNSLNSEPNHPTLLNRKFDDKTYNYINTRFPNQHIIEESEIFDFMNRFNNYCDNPSKDSSFTKVYVFYYDEEWCNFSTIYFDTIIQLANKYKVFFCLRVSYQENMIQENLNLINDSQLVLLYIEQYQCDQSDNIKRKIYKDEIKAIAKKKQDCLFFIRGHNDIRVPLLNSKIMLGNSVGIYDNISDKLNNFFASHSIEQIKKEGKI